MVIILRSLNGDGTWRSDCDPQTCLFYIMGENHGIMEVHCICFRKHKKITEKN